MTPLPAQFNGGSMPAVHAWRLDREIHAPTWDSGIGAEISGGRWNPKRMKAVYCALDPATTILEVAVHLGLSTLDGQFFKLTSMEILDPTSFHVVQPGAVPNYTWLHNGPPSASQQAFGGALLAAHDFVLFPSVVSKSSWNLVFNPVRAAGKYKMLTQEWFGLDTRLNPPKP
jgi:RES domain-containing protein